MNICKTKKVINYSFVIIIVLIILILPFWGYISNKIIHDPIATRFVKTNNLLSEIKLIEFTRTLSLHKRVTLIIGIDSSGKEKAVWLDFKEGRFNSKLYHSVDLTGGISRNQARQIAIENDLVSEISYIGLRYAEGPWGDWNNGVSFDKGEYWYIQGTHNRVYINFKAGDYAVHDNYKWLKSTDS